MKHTELLHDQPSIERGEELVALYIQGLTQLRANGPFEREHTYDYGKDIYDLLDDGMAIDEPDSKGFEHLGRAVAGLRRRQVWQQTWKDQDETETPEWEAAYRPVIMFLEKHDGKPVAAMETREAGMGIKVLGESKRKKRFPRMVGGFIMPEVIGNAQLYIADTPDTNVAHSLLQIINRKSVDSYTTTLKIAVGE